MVKHLLGIKGHFSLIYVQFNVSRLPQPSSPLRGLVVGRRWDNRGKSSLRGPSGKEAMGRMDTCPFLEEAYFGT